MVKMHTTKLADYEKEDPVWWCEHHKSTLGLVALRLEQVLDGRKDLDAMCRILIKNIKEKNGIERTMRNNPTENRRSRMYLPLSWRLLRYLFIYRFHFIPDFDNNPYKSPSVPLFCALFC